MDYEELSGSTSTAEREMDPSPHPESFRSRTTSSVRSAGERPRSRSPSVPRSASGGRARSRASSSSGERATRGRRPVLSTGHSGEGDELVARTPVTKVLSRSLDESVIQSPAETASGDARAQINEGRGAGRPPRPSGFASQGSGSTGRSSDFVYVHHGDEEMGQGPRVMPTTAPSTRKLFQPPTWAVAASGGGGGEPPNDPDGAETTFYPLSPDGQDNPETDPCAGQDTDGRAIPGGFYPVRSERDDVSG